MIDFNRPALVGKELNYIQDAVAQGMLCGWQIHKAVFRMDEETF